MCFVDHAECKKHVRQAWIHFCISDNNAQRSHARIATCRQCFVLPSRHEANVGVITLLLLFHHDGRLDTLCARKKELQISK